ncbi:Holliday junction resolvase RuvX [Fusibacter sp. JL216-2]|uniref:Holliday junction resolvase RuvX n=1 Tax=Fusibacter sp. JL216-2 TaxID=3071453 RepID=UPI003D34D878
MKMLGLDVGDRTIGVAVSDPTGFLASPVETIMRESNKQSIARIVELLIESKSEKIVVGLPKNMNGTIGPQGEKTIAFVKQLEKKLKYSKRLEEKEIEIIMWDERLTTKAAERTLIESDMRREKRKEVIDQLAAVYILQGYLDHIR